MEAHGVVPDTLDSAPAHVAEVKFPSGVSMSLGNELTPRDVAETPTEIKWPTEPGALYSLLFIDLDAPSRDLPAYRDIVHWLVCNVDQANIAKGDTVFNYVGSGAPEGTSLHRYVLLVLKQSGKIDTQSIPNGAMKDRFGFNTRAFIAQHKLLLVAGNFFLAQVDDYVRQRRAKLLETGFKTHQIVPDVVDTVPKYCAEVVYPNGMLILSHGDELHPRDVKDTPAILAWPTEAGALYTLLFVDPDAPSRVDPHLGQFLHWLVLNISGNDITSGDTIAQFIGSGPPKDSSLHRYVYLVYKQAGKINWTKERITNRSATGRGNFKVRDFVKENNLSELVAGSLYQAQYDSYVPTLHAQLGFK